jgi:DNA polymerase-1
MDTILIIDSHALIHRAYHAIPPLTTKSGIPTNALYGYFNLIQKAITDIKPTHLVACFDTPTESFRKKIVEHYQATRKPTEDNLKVQFNLVKEIVDAAHIKRYEADGYEADDVMGTIVEQITSMSYPFTPPKNPSGELPQGSKQSFPSGRGTQRVEGVHDIRIIILTGDKDMFQLVNDRVYVLTPQIGFSKSLLYGAKEVQEKLGIPPDKVADFKALSGDASDNYEGIRKIGPKTAVKLIEQYGSVENMSERFDSETMDMLRKMKEVSTIVRDVPNIDVHLDELVFQGFKGDDLLKALQKYELYSLISRFFPRDTQKSEETKPKGKNDDPPSQDSLF